MQTYILPTKVIHNWKQMMSAFSAMWLQVRMAEELGIAGELRFTMRPSWPLVMTQQQVRLPMLPGILHHLVLPCVESLI